jgi:hypothetical protein
VKGQTLRNLGLAAGAAGITAAVVWYFADRQLDRSFAQGVDDLQARLRAGGVDMEAQLHAGRRELRETLGREIQVRVPAETRAAVVSTLTTYGITPRTGRELARVVAAADTVLSAAQRYAAGLP